MDSVLDRTARRNRLHFAKTGSRGFGDRQNSWAWSMLWWRGTLYVGTNRAFLPTERAALHRALPWLGKMPFVKYPPDDPDIVCPPDPADLPVCAEIWCWTPEQDRWERVYSSPQDVPIPGRPGKFVARDIGFRDMAVFVEPDGSEAMYVSGVNSRYFSGDVPAPRLLRTVDGRHFDPVPQEPGTVMGSLKISTLRTLISYNDRLFVTAGRINGDGTLYAAANPAGGNDHFRQVSPGDMQVFEMVTFNGFLYLGLRDPKNGYAVVKTDATGAPPYRFTPVVEHGAYAAQPSLSVISMHVFQNRLYVGADRPAEIIRIHPDDSWELVLGSPRQTPDGPKHPISGLDAGFYNWLNGHIWRMQEYEDRLYVGTMNMATHLRDIPEADQILQHAYGFNLFASADGCDFVPLTLDGFGEKFDFGLRTFAKTPHGLFFGTANSWYGLQIWQGLSTASPADHAAAPELISANGNGPSIPLSRRGPQMGAAQSIAQLAADVMGERVLLSWQPAADAHSYRIWRATLGDQRRVIDRNPFVRRLLKVIRSVLPMLRYSYLPPLPDKLWIPGPYAERGVSEGWYFEDHVAPGERYLYYVEALGATGEAGERSNLVAAPSLAAPANFATLMTAIDAAGRRRQAASIANLDALQVSVMDARSAIRAGDVERAADLLHEMIARLAPVNNAADPGLRADLRRLLQKIARRLELCRLGLIDVESL